jgi:ubiquinone/menaquinone biosynthesis C-methylase UbiE
VGRLLYPKSKTVLNVGGGSKDIPLPLLYNGYKQILLDIDPAGNPDVVCDAREMKAKLSANQYDAVYCSHNLEHYYHHDVPKVLEGIYHVLKPGGFAHIRVPDIVRVMEIVMQENLDLEDKLYNTSHGPITALDVIYGWSHEIERSNQPFYAHKTAFTVQSLTNALMRVGFVELKVKRAREDREAGYIEIRAIGYKR